MPLERINDVKFKQSVFERIVGAGDLTIESGGEYGQNRFTDIRKPEEVQKTIFEQSEKNQARPAAATAAPARPTRSRPTTGPPSGWGSTRDGPRA